MPVEIFCCYARTDQSLLKRLTSYLAPLQRQGLITVWADTDINAGAEWEREIEKHLNTAQIILLLVSPDFMASDYCFSREMRRAIERYERGEASVIPVILRPVYWQGSPIGKLQALPTNGKPVRYWPNQEKAFFDVAEGIRKVAEMLHAQPVKGKEDELADTSVAASKPVQKAPIVPTIEETRQKATELPLEQVPMDIPPEPAYTSSPDPLVQSPQPIPLQQSARPPLSPPRNISGENDGQTQSQSGSDTERETIQEHKDGEPKPTIVVLPPAGTTPRISGGFFRSTGKVAGPIALALLVIGGGIVYAVTTSNAKLQAAAKATATANAIDAQVIATANAIGLYNPYGGKLALNDPMQDDSKGNDWLQSSQVEGSCKFSGGAYHINAIKVGYIDPCSAFNTDFRNFTFQVEMTIIKGDAGGIIFRLSEEQRQWYYLQIDRSGFYDFYCYPREIAACTPVLKRGYTVALKTSLNQSNIVAVVAYYDFFYIYINGKYIASLQDEKFSHGRIGVVADATYNPAEVVFRNAKVWTF